MATLIELSKLGELEQCHDDDTILPMGRLFLQMKKKLFWWTTPQI